MLCFRHKSSVDSATLDGAHETLTAISSASRNLRLSRPHRPPPSSLLDSSVRLACASLMSNMASVVSTTQTDVLDQIFAGLKNKSHDVRVQSAIELQRYVGRSPCGVLTLPMPPHRSPMLPRTCPRTQLLSSGTTLSTDVCSISSTVRPMSTSWVASWL